MILRSLFRRSEGARNCFPDIDKVFHDPVGLDLVFFPLLSINLKEVIPDRNDWVHFVDVWDNGDLNDSMFNEYRTRDSIRFKLEDSRYRYFGDKNAFNRISELKKWNNVSYLEFNSNIREYVKIPTPEEYQKSKRRQNELIRKNVDFDYSLYVGQKISYLINRERFRQNGKLVTHKYLPKENVCKVHQPIKQIGGSPNWENQDLTPVTKCGTPLTFIGLVVGYRYLEYGSDRIYLFLDESTDEVVQVFQHG